MRIEVGLGTQVHKGPRVEVIPHRRFGPRDRQTVGVEGLRDLLGVIAWKKAVLRAEVESVACQHVALREPARVMVGERGVEGRSIAVHWHRVPYRVDELSPRGVEV